MADARAPHRLQVQGDFFHGVVPDGAVYVGRAAPGLPTSPYANPFRVGHRAENHPLTGDEVIVLNAEHAVELYALWLTEQAKSDPWFAQEVRHALAGRDLACWCKRSQPCHVDPLLLFANVGRLVPRGVDTSAAVPGSLTWVPGRGDYGADHSSDLIATIEDVNCSQGCAHAGTRAERKEFGPGGNCTLLAMVAAGAPFVQIPDLDPCDDGPRCRRRTPPPPPKRREKQRGTEPLFALEESTHA